MSDDDSTRTHRRHVGSHGDYCFWMGSTRESIEKMDDIAKDIAAFLRDRRGCGPLLIVNFCKWGKHRSVCTGAAEVEALRSDDSLAVAGVHVQCARGVSCALRANPRCEACSTLGPHHLPKWTHFMRFRAFFEFARRQEG